MPSNEPNNEPTENDTILSDSFEEGEEVGINAVKEVIKSTMAAYKGPKNLEKRLIAFSGFTAGYLSTFFYHSYKELLRLTKESGLSQNTVDLWCQKIMTLFGERVAGDDVPVKLHFMINREGGEK